MSDKIKYLPITELLKDIIDNRGKSVPTSSEGTPLIATNCIKHSSIYPTFEKIRYVDEDTLNTWFRAHLKPNDILFVNKGTPGRVCLVPNPVNFCAAQDMIGLRCDENVINYKYLFAVLRSSEVQKKIENYHVGLVIPHFRKQDLPNLLIPIKSPEEQEAIGELYLTLSKKIEINNRINAELEAMAKTLYDYWFVHNDKTRKWEIARLGDFVKVNERSITKDYPYDKIEYIDISSVSLGRLEGTTAYPLKDSPSRARRLVQHGDTIWSTVRPNRKSYLFISNPKENLVVSTGFAVLTPKKIPPSFLYFLTTTEQFVNYLVSNAEGSAYPAVSAERFSDAAFSIPPENLLMEFESIASPALTQIAHNGKENHTLAALRDWLLPLLMNGQASVG